MGLIQTISRLWRPARVESAAGLEAFVAAESAYIGQKTVDDYCRAKTGAFSHALFKEERFLKELTISRWESFAAISADVLVITEGVLRPHAGERAAALATRLAESYPRILTGQGVPEHRSNGWDDVIAEFAPRVARAQLAAPLSPPDVAKASAHRMFKTLPIHQRYSGNDEAVLTGSVSFQLVALLAKIREVFDNQAIVDDLLRRTP
jgi:hypothetical protein